MSSYQKYRTDFSSRTSSSLKKNRKQAQNRLVGLKQQRYYSERALSSLSLPIFTRARLRFYHRSLNHKRLAFPQMGRFPISESEILGACLILFLSKSRNNKAPLFANSQRFRSTRQYNEDRYSYEKVTTYLPNTLWRMFQLRALEMKISLSQLADLALRLYLGVVVSRLTRDGKNGTFASLAISGEYAERQNKARHRKAWPHALRATGREWLNHILDSCSYQIILKKEQIASFSGGRSGDFFFGYRLIFGCPPAFSPTGIQGTT